MPEADLESFVTEKRRRSGLLAASAEILDLLPTAVYVVDADGLIVSCNRRAAELWGRQPVLGDPAERFCGSHRLFLPDGTVLPHDACPVADVLRDGVAARDREAIIERPDGTRIVALVDIEPLFEDGNLVGAVNCFQDITARKQIEERLRRGEQALAASAKQAHDLVEAIPEAIYTTDAKGCITFYNAAAAALWGREPELGRAEWCGSWRLYWPDGAPMRHEDCPMATALKEDRPVRGAEAIMERPDGTRVPFAPYPTPLHDDSGKLIGAVNMLIDLTERRAAEESSSRLAAIVESSDDAIVGKTLDGIITSWNRGAEKLFGYKAWEAIGKPVLILIPLDRQDEEMQIIARIRRGERFEPRETIRRRKDGSLVEVSLTVSPIRNAEGRIVGASKIARDISERKRAEEKTRLLAREVDHRSKNMLATVQAIVRMTRGETVQDFTTAFMGRLMALSRAHTMLAENRWTGGDLHRLIGEELSAYRKGSGRVHIAGPTLNVSPDAAQALALTLHELATNAVKYGALSNATGSVTIESRHEAEDHVMLHWTETGGPPVSAPAQRGFGTKLIEATIHAQLDGEVRFDWRAEGLACRLSFPRDRLSPTL